MSSLILSAPNGGDQQRIVRRHHGPTSLASRAPGSLRSMARLGVASPAAATAVQSNTRTAVATNLGMTSPPPLARLTPALSGRASGQAPPSRSPHRLTLATPSALASAR